MKIKGIVVSIHHCPNGMSHDKYGFHFTGLNELTVRIGELTEADVFSVKVGDTVKLEVKK